MNVIQSMITSKWLALGFCINHNQGVKEVITGETEKEHTNIWR